jgi:Transposase C of IS166 homeodomain
MIAALKLEIEKLRRALCGTKSERQSRLLEQLELQLEELEASATQDQLAAERVAGPGPKPAGTTGRRRPGRKPFPGHLPRERVVIATPTTCGSAARPGSWQLASSAGLAQFSRLMGLATAPPSRWSRQPSSLTRSRRCTAARDGATAKGTRPVWTQRA